MAPEVLENKARAVSDARAPIESYRGSILGVGPGCGRLRAPLSGETLHGGSAHRHVTLEVDEPAFSELFTVFIIITIIIIIFLF